LFNVCFKFGVIAKTVFGSPKKMTTRKFFGSHFHSIVSHLPVIYRIFNTKTILTEQEERGFGDIRSISERTTNRKPGQNQQFLINDLEQVGHCYFEKSVLGLSGRSFD
jgi:hypothetical protein